MLSICIPIFNNNISKLTQSLVQQAERLELATEILLLDDGSSPEFKAVNRNLESLGGVHYAELETNVGRAAIRNKLAQRARYAYLLFLDADSMLVSKQFLSNYAAVMGQYDLVCGGTVYAPHPPADDNQLLRYRYGKKREEMPPEERQKRGFAITANNFMIRKEVLLEVPFREEIRQYGHEDTVLGYDLHRQGIVIWHIDNPVEHTGLETSEIFLQKTELAIKNLWHIGTTLLPNQNFIQNSALLRARKTCDALNITRVLGSLFKLVAASLRVHLTGRNPQIGLFQLYKFGFLCSLPRK